MPTAFTTALHLRNVFEVTCSTVLSFSPDTHPFPTLSAVSVCLERNLKGTLLSTVV
jgi:hypothetical protein